MIIISIYFKVQISGVKWIEIWRGNSVQFHSAHQNEILMVVNLQKFDFYTPRPTPNTIYL